MMNLWYRQNAIVLTEKLKQLNTFTHNPYLTPLCTEVFNFSDIPLYLIALTYDACRMIS